mmetsp:Transcript_61687/g.176913  ORF Transcript_61687/g.176913 Transcript_61687/m.176913 type:complete len:217 (-) Transcript_61687:115-765(-)
MFRACASRCSTRGARHRNAGASCSRSSREARQAAARRRRQGQAPSPAPPSAEDETQEEVESAATKRPASRASKSSSPGMRVITIRARHMFGASCTLSMAINFGIRTPSPKSASTSPSYSTHLAECRDMLKTSLTAAIPPAPAQWAAQTTPKLPAPNRPVTRRGLPSMETCAPAETSKGSCCAGGMGCESAAGGTGRTPRGCGCGNTRATEPPTPFV